MRAGIMPAILIVSLGLFSEVAAAASNQDEARCKKASERTWLGITSVDKVKYRECLDETWRASQGEAAQPASEQPIRDPIPERIDPNVAARAAAKEEERRRAEQYRAQEDARRAQYEQEQARLDQMDREAAAKEAAMQKLCGADYKQVRVGMTFARVQQCVGEFELVSQISRADGVVSTYRRRNGHVYVMDGKVIAWQAPH